MFPKRYLKAEEQQEIEKFMFIFFNRVRDIFEFKKRKNGQVSCYFDAMLSHHCRLPVNYNEIKEQVSEYLKEEKGSSEELFEAMYRTAIPYHNLYHLLKDLISKVLPAEMLGYQNTSIFVGFLKDFISMKRFENFKIE